MNILVTGGAGFIGSHIADAYIKAGHSVVIVDDLSTGRQQNINKKAEFIQCDIRDEQIDEILRDYNIDVVNHQAAQMNVRFSVENPMYDAEVNIIGLLNILQNCVKHQVKKVIFASSGGVVYGEQESFPAHEEHKQQPCSPYGVAKLSGEKYLYYYSLTYNLNYTALRYANVYGPRQNPQGEAGVVAIFFEKMMNGEQAVITGDGKQTRDFVYIDDVVSANLAALIRGDNQVFNIGTGTETDINTIFSVLNELTHAGLPETHGPGLPGEQRRSVIAIDKAKDILKWEPKFDLKSGLAETVKRESMHV